MKPIPFISIVGYGLDLGSGILSVMKWTPRDEVYKFLLDPVNYPNTKLYEKRIADYVTTLADTRLYDATSAVGSFVDVFYMFLDLNALLNPLMWILNFLLSWFLIVFNLMKTLLVIGEPIMWLNKPLKWIPIPAPETTSE